MLETFITLGTRPFFIQPRSVVGGTPSRLAASLADTKLLIVEKDVDNDELMCIMTHKFVVDDELYYSVIWCHRTSR